MNGMRVLGLTEILAPRDYCMSKATRRRNEEKAALSDESVLEECSAHELHRSTVIDEGQ